MVVRPHLPATEQLLVEGGDARIALDPDSGLNQYGCSPFPDPDGAAFGSATASIISPAGLAAANHLRHRLLLASGAEPRAATYAREINRIRGELVRWCGVADLPGLDVVFAASGTDIHLISAQLAGGAESMPALTIMADAAETGSCVPAALAGRHFSTRSTLGNTVAEGAPIADDGAMEVVTTPIRHADGFARPTADIDAEVESLATGAAAMGRRVLLILIDVSKTGLIAPSPGCVLALHRRLPDTVDVLVDACQFRIAPSTLRAYLAHGFMVALTGSKFVTGPTFSGALLIPASIARRLRGRPLPRALHAYSARADWPQGWAAAERLDNAANFGLLLRWEAALQELRAFRSAPENAVARFLQAFARAVRRRLLSDPLFEPLPLSPLDRRPLAAATSWDHIPTIFPFLLYPPGSSAGKTPLNHEKTMQVYRLLQVDLVGRRDLDRTGFIGDIAALRCQLGQPVACGNRDGAPLSALRLCASARLIVEATAQDGRNASAVIERALAALDKTALLVRSLPNFNPPRTP